MSRAAPLTFLAFLLGCASSAAPGAVAPAPRELVVGTDACATDGDCVPHDCCGCCPARACVAVTTGTSCPDVVCEDMCPLGCGGACVCHEGHCATIVR